MQGENVNLLLWKLKIKALKYYLVLVCGIEYINSFIVLVVPEQELFQL